MKSEQSEEEDSESLYLDAEGGCKEPSLEVLLEAIRDAESALDLFLSNRFEEAEERVGELSGPGRSMYHALAHAAILFIRAMMTRERADIELGLEDMKAASAVIEKSRPQYSFADSIYSRLGGGGGGGTRFLTTSEMHAELCYAESLMFCAILTFFRDESMASLIRGTLRLRSSYQAYRECHRIISGEEDCNGLDDEKVRRQFEAGVRMGIGTFNLVLSTMPTRILRVLELVGFSGSKSVGLMELQLASQMRSTLRCPLASLTLLGWHLFATFFVGVGQPDLDLCRQLLAPLVEKFPKGAIILFLRARLHLVSGEIDNAIYFYRECIDSQTTYKQFDHADHWELIFAYAYVGRWDRAANHAKQLLNAESRWSRCVYAYLLAVLIQAEAKNDLHGKWKSRCLDDKREHTCRYLFGTIPGSRRRIAGKSIPIEKFCERKARRYLSKGQLYFAHYEFLYIWGGFTILESAPSLVRRMFDEIESLWSRESSGDHDDTALYRFLKGVCHRAMREWNKAEECFIKVLEGDSRLAEFTYLPPNACFELALVNHKLGRRDAIEPWLAKARSYSGYLLETKLHFRIHGAMEALVGGRTPSD